jgi:prepilin-type N-terminal cleavage/methylation domain-containing protein
MRYAPSRGVTLVELLVVLALLGLLLGVSGLALASLREPRETDELRELVRARAEAVQSGVPQTARGVLFLPDGRAIGPNVDRLTGALHEP